MCLMFLAKEKETLMLTIQWSYVFAVNVFKNLACQSNSACEVYVSEDNVVFCVSRQSIAPQRLLSADDMKCYNVKAFITLNPC